MGRSPCCDKSSVKKGPWSPEEDRKLKEYIEKHGTGGNWIALPQKAGLKRCGKSCRLRWLNYLRPNIKHGEFSDDEDRIICSIFASIGSRWSIMASQLPGRTDNDIKNYWNTKLKKKIFGVDAFHKKSQQITSSTHVRPSENMIFNTNSTGFTSSARQMNSTDFTEGNSGHVGFASLIAVKDEVFIFEGNQVTSGSESIESRKQLNHGSDQEWLEGSMYNGFYDKEMLLLNEDELERRNQAWGETPSETFFQETKPITTSFDYNMFLNNRNPVSDFHFQDRRCFTSDFMIMKS